MCRADYSDGETLTELRSGFLKGRKVHTCDECHRLIPKGESHYSFDGICEGSHTNFRTCAHCYVLTRWLVKNCGGYLFCEVVEDVAEHADEYPDLREPLEAVVQRARAKWDMPFFGGLMPIPDLPPSITIAENENQG